MADYADAVQGVQPQTAAFELLARVHIKEKNTILARMLIKCPRVDLRVKDKNGSSLQRVTRYEELQ